jgi:enamine deaminase RidA (YjgF/YER057c/UK114 family)
MSRSTELVQVPYKWEEISRSQKAKQQCRINTTNKEGAMKRRRFQAVNVGTLVLGGLLLVSGGPGTTPAGAQNLTPQQQQQQQLRQILDKLDQVLAATKSASAAAEATKSDGAEDNNTLRWDQALPVSQRFVVLAAFNSDAVLDKETGLVWEKSPQATALSLSNARLTCANKAVGGRKGWRLPSLPELASLVDPSVASPGPTLQPGHPFLAVQSANYWSGSAHADNSTLMWGVGFNNGVVLGVSKSFDQRAWCVRGGMSAE